MSIALPGKQLLGIGCCLFVVSGLTAQPAAPHPQAAGNDQALQQGGVRVPAANEEQLRQLAIQQMILEQRPSLLETPPIRRENLEPPEFARWTRWLLYALMAAGGLGGGWGAKRAFATKQSPAADSPKPRVEQVGLGADGKAGMWLREVPPWEK